MSKHKALLRKLEKKIDLSEEYINNNGILRGNPKLDNELTRFWANNEIPWYHCRLDLMKIAIKETKVLGMYLEFGTLTGNTINALSKLIGNKTIYGFDSWKGYPEDFADHHKGDWAIPRPNSIYDEPERKKEQYQVRGNVRLIEGFFQDSLPKFLKKHPIEKVAFVHMDCDLYSSTKYVLDTLYNKLQIGTTILFNTLFYRKDLEGNILYWIQDSFNAWYDFIGEKNIEFEWLGSQSFCCAIMITGMEKNE